MTWALAALFGVGIFIPSLMSQANKGIISGTVTETSGVAIVGANIEVKNVATGVTYPAVTDSHGQYIVPELSVGAYQVQASKSGFQTIVHSDITLTVGAHPLVDFKLPIAASLESPIC
jgi:hypothetical protein